VYLLGGALLLLLLLETITGILLLFYYDPTLPAAHASVSEIQAHVRFGWLVRSLHHTGAHATVALILIHGFSTFVRRCFRPPREATWWTGGLLGLLVAGLAYSGTILPWSQSSLYAAQVGLSLVEAVPFLGNHLAQALRGGSTLGPATLHRAFVLHVAALPAATILLAAVHGFLVHAHGLQPSHTSESSPSVPWRSFLPRASLAWILMLNLVVAVAALAPPALEPAADLFAPSAGHVHPPWFFLAVFQLAQWLSPLATITLLAAAALLFALAPWWAGAERGARGPRATLVIAATTAIALTWLTVAGYGG
jgi:ubiquinol-cytochrome c reductase cytochrome b subunit